MVGTLVPFERLSKHTDWARVRRVISFSWGDWLGLINGQIYKLNDDLALKGIYDEGMLRSKVDAIVSATVATKTMQA